AELLEVAQLVDHHRVPEMQVGRRRVEPELDAQFAAGAQLRPQLGLVDKLHRPPTDGLNGLLDGGHGRFAAGGRFVRLRRLMNNKVILAALALGAGGVALAAFATMAPRGDTPQPPPGTTTFASLAIA